MIFAYFLYSVSIIKLGSPVFIFPCTLILFYSLSVNSMNEIDFLPPLSARISVTFSRIISRKLT